MSANWNYPTAIRNGAGRINELADICLEFGIKAPLLVTDPGLAALPMVDDALALCRKEGLSIDIFSGIKSNPTGENVNDGIEKFKVGGHDGVIAFGGGSALDAGKAIALLAKQSCDLWDLEDIGDNWQNAKLELIMPTIAVPTTSGTGSEVGRASVITNSAEHRKVIIFHAQMLPVCVILDPALTVGLPAGLTAATGMDALSHNLEAYCSPFFHPTAEGIAVEGIRLVKEYLPTAVSDGSNIDARNQMLISSMMGATAFQRGLGGMHALAHPLGALFDAHHGALNAVLMPYVLRANRSAIEARIERLARYIGLESSFDAFLTWVLDLRKEIGIPDTLAEIGIDDSCMETIGEMAVADAASGGNPIQFDAKAYQEIFKAALG